MHLFAFLLDEKTDATLANESEKEQNNKMNHFLKLEVI